MLSDLQEDKLFFLYVLLALLMTFSRWGIRHHFQFQVLALRPIVEPRGCHKRPVVCGEKKYHAVFLVHLNHPDVIHIEIVTDLVKFWDFQVYEEKSLAKSCFNKCSPWA